MVEAVAERMVLVAVENYPNVDNLLNTVGVEAVPQTILRLVVLYLVLVEVEEVKVVIPILMVVLGIISPKVEPVTDLRMKIQI